MPPTFDHSEFPLPALLEAKRGPLTAVLPSRECAPTVGPIVAMLGTLDGLFDQILVVDAASGDGTAEVARAAGAEVVQDGELMPEFGAVMGKGDAMWRALSAATGEIVLYLDGDSVGLAPEFALGLVGPLILKPEVQYVKGAFDRPFRFGEEEVARGGGRVTELMARPLLSAFYPELAGFRQPLAGEMAGRRALLTALPWPTGYAAEISMLIDVYNEVGLDGMAQVEVGERRQPHQPLVELGPMAYTILRAVMERLRREGRAPEAPPLPFHRADGRLVDVEPAERPPIATVGAAA